MSLPIEKIRSRLEIEFEDLPHLEAKASNPSKDQDGRASDLIAGSHRYIGIATYLLAHDTRRFRDSLSKAARIADSLFLRFEEGEPISPSFVSMTAYQSVFDALAADDMELARALAAKMGCRHEIEKEQDHPFDLTLGYALKSFVLDDQAAMKKWSTALGQICRQADNKNFHGYAETFEAMLEGDEEQATEAVRKLIDGHKNESKANGVFSSTVDRYLCVWGLGLVNLARHKGLRIEGPDPLIPPELLSSPVSADRGTKT